MTAATPEARMREKFEPWLVQGEPNSAGEMRGYCPIHEEPGASGTPSASFNFTKGVFECFSSCGGMTLRRLLKLISLDGGAAGNVSSIGDAPSKRRAEGRRANARNELPSEEQLQEYVDVLINTPLRLKIMREKRGFTVDTITRFQIGWDGERYTIPVRDADGELVNVRRYSPEAKNPKDKMRSWGIGLGEAELFYPSFLRDHDEVILTEGETDCIIGQQYGLPTVTHTGGARTFKAQWCAAFQDKTVFICYDLDDAGQAGALKAANLLKRFAAKVYILRLEDLQEKGADLTDWLVSSGRTADDFREFMDRFRDRPYFVNSKYDDTVSVEPEIVGLERSMSAELSGRPLSMTVSVAGKVQPAYVLPRAVTLVCDGQAGAKCKSCPMMAKGLQDQIKIKKHDLQLLEMIDASSEKVQGILKREAGIPTTCTRVEADIYEKWNVEELVVVPSVDDRTEEAQTPINRSVYNVGEYATQVNTAAQLVGMNTASPKNGRAVFQSWECKPVLTNLDTFEVDEATIERLSVFRPAKGQTPIDKMREVAIDLSSNVTRIYGRPELHMAYDAVWHSVMDFSFKGVRLGKGWLELLVMGDTRTGKSEVAGRLCDHYSAGVLKSCEGATFAGLVGGAQQMGSSWMVTWGTIPLNDRRLVVLDEVSGIKDKNIIDQMSAVRSSGRAQITKIVGQETSARTRLIWISNPPEGNTIEEMPGGAIDAIQDLIKNPEDISRFDLAMSAASGDVQSSVINSREHREVEHKFTTELCSELVNWVWSRKAHDIVWAEGVEDYVLESAEKFGPTYVPEPPLIQAENVRIKLARIAVAIAARCFSSSADGTKIFVKNDHVDAAMELLEILYGMRSFGYKHRSSRVLIDRKASKDNLTKTRKFLLANEDVLTALLQCRGGDFKVRDFCEFAGMSQDEAQVATRWLMDRKMIRRMSRGYIRAMPVLITLLNRLEDQMA